MADKILLLLKFRNKLIADEIYFFKTNIFNKYLNEKVMKIREELKEFDYGEDPIFDIK